MSVCSRMHVLHDLNNSHVKGGHDKNLLKETLNGTNRAKYKVFNSPLMTIFSITMVFLNTL